MEKKSTTMASVEKGSSQERSFIDMFINIFLLIGLVGGLIGLSPFVSLGTEFLKSGLVLVGVISSFLLFLLQVLKKNEFALPNSLFMYVLPILPLVYLISAFFSPVPYASLIGYGFEIGTVGFIFVMCLATFLVSTLYREKKNVIWFQMFLFGLAGLIILLQIVNFIFPSAFGFLGFSGSILHIIGSNSDVAVFFSLMMIISLVSLEFAPWGKTGKRIALAFGILSLIMAALTSFGPLWILTGLFALVVFISLYSFSGRFFPEAKGNRLSYYSLGLVVISAVFAMFGPNITGLVYSKLGLTYNAGQTPPTISETIPVIKETLKTDAVLGVGPNRFVSQWLKYKPISVITGPSWGIDFNYGNSLFQTSFVTTGLVGAISWLLLLIVLIYSGIRHVFLKEASKVSGYLTFSSFLIASFLFLSLGVSVPSAGMMILIFFALGFFISSLYASGSIEKKTFSFGGKPVTSFTMVLLIVVLLIAGVSFDYIVAGKVYASYNYKEAAIALSQKDFDRAESLMLKATSFGGSDIYYRGFADIYIAQLKDYSTQISANPTESQIQYINEVTTKAINIIRLTLGVDSTNYLNYMTGGSVSSLFVSPKESEAYNAAKAYYSKALELAPKNPSIYLSLASLEQLHGDASEAERAITNALSLKIDYTQARFLWAQIQIANNNTRGAIRSLEEAARISPRDAGIPFQLGLLHFNAGEYIAATESFKRVTEMIPSHANARYYLGLIYEKQGRRVDALEQFNIIKQTNPDNADLIQIIDRLTANKPLPDVSLDELPLDDTQ